MLAWITEVYIPVLKGKNIATFTGEKKKQAHAHPKIQGRTRQRRPSFNSNQRKTKARSQRSKNHKAITR